MSETDNADDLRDLGRASVQIVHDLKNQMNGLKLYATFLRKRLEKAERPTDEQETITKLIAGLDRASTDMTLLVRYGRPLELRRASHVDLAKLLIGATNSMSASVKTDNAKYEGDFDAPALTEALRNITSVALASRNASVNDEDKELAIHLSKRDTNTAEAIIEWSKIKSAETQNLFTSFIGSEGLRMALAAKIIKAHGGLATHEADTLRVRLPLKSRG